MSLQQLKENEVFKVQRDTAQELYDKALSSVLNDVPGTIQQFLVRERLIGAAQELKRFLDQPTEMEGDLNQQIENQQNERN